ncbi:S8 family serine peptidase, partial [Xanthomonas sp. Kuri4-2]
MLALALGSAGQAAAQAAQDGGSVGDPDSWVTEEFQADWGLSAINAQYAYARGLSGQGVRLGLFDSGVALSHPEFAGKDANGLHVGDVLADGSVCSNETLLTPDACFASSGDTVAVDYVDYDPALIQYLVDIGYLNPGARAIIEQYYAGARYATHGTHVAGSMAANRDGSGTQGVAFGADLTAARMFGNTYMDTAGFIQSIGGDVRDVGIDLDGVSLGVGPDTSSFESMYRQMEAQGVRAINHSWGLTNEPASAAAMDRLYAANADYFATFTDPSLRSGVLQVWAAGNNDGAIAGVYATLPRYVPDVEKYWLSVVNINQTGGIDGSSSICGLSQDWCVAAPGTDITSSVIEGTPGVSVIRDADGTAIGMQVDASNPEYGYGDLTGTSMAAPHVTGALALLMERFPYLDGPQVRDILLTTATDLGAAGVDAIYGWGLIDLQKAIDGPGQFRVDTDVVMNQRAGGAQVWAGGAWDDWSNDIGGPGRLTKSGIGWLRLSGDNRFAGASVREGVLELTGRNALSADVSVDGNALLMLSGTLEGANLTINSGYAVVNGTVSNGVTTVGLGGTLNGNGTLGDTVVRGTIAPGNSIGRLTIDGDYLQAAGSTYNAELLPPDQADLLAITGTATLQGGTLKLIPLGGVYALGQRYSLLSADGGVNGRFAAVDTSAISPFMAIQLNYGSTLIGLDVTRGSSLASAATTANQRATATAIDALDLQQPLLQRVAALFPAEAV